jgi:transcriptional regulator with XRE-family HTH domain
MTRNYTKKAEHWTKKPELRDLASKHESSENIQKKKAQLVKNLREWSGLSQLELGSLIGKSHDGVYRLEAAKARITPELEDKITSVIAERIELSYIAGLIDRRCVFTIFKAQPKSYNPRTQTGYEIRILFNTQHKILAELIQKVTNSGRVLPRRTENRISWSFQAFTAEAETVLTMIQPYLKIKKPLADLMLDLREIQNENRNPRAKTNNKEYVNRQEEIYQKFMTKKDLLSGG